eukprot:496806-Rhodomonas_salina.6
MRVCECKCVFTPSTGLGRVRRKLRQDSGGGTARGSTARSDDDRSAPAMRRRATAAVEGSGSAEREKRDSCMWCFETMRGRACASTHAGCTLE